LGRAEKPNRALFPAFAPAVNAGFRLPREGRASGRTSFLEALPFRAVLEPRVRLPLRAEELGLPTVLVPLARPLR